MPFDVQDFPGAPSGDRAASRSNRRLVAGWLFIVAGMIVVMIGLGGVTRLTGSGLSIMEWAPFRGAIPPLNDADWHKLFALYQQIPQYSLVNEGFGLHGFKQIFWLEWTHRLWGRLIGLVFIVPLIWFWLTGRIERRLVPRLIGLFVLGGLQGAVGWFMVASGFLPDATSVSPARLVAHLVLALLLYAAIVWTGLSVLWPVPLLRQRVPGLRPFAIAAVTCVAVTIVAGGFVAGTHAGLEYNTFPLMAGSLVPDGYAALHPFLRNLTQNIAAVQFDHRLMATLTLLTVGATVTLGLCRATSVAVRRILIAAGTAVALQYALGVTTLLLVVPVDAATAHQVGASLLLTTLLVLLHAIRPIRARSVRA